MTPQDEDTFMQKAIDSAYEGIRKEEGGPFGACIVKEGKVIAVGHNTVLKDHDPTCHAEMNVIRAAARHLGTHILSDCELYTTAEPCPMCLAAIYWSRIKKYYVGVSKECAANYGFDDAFFYDEMQKTSELRGVASEAGIRQEACSEVFAEWRDKGGKLY